MTSEPDARPKAGARGTRSRRRAGRVAVVVLTLAVLAGAAGVAYAVWSQATAVQTTVGNGFLDIDYTSPPPDFAFTCTTGTNTCAPASQTSQMTFANSGSIPIAAYLAWSTEDSGYCAYFDVTLALVGAGSPIFSGDLCTLLFEGRQEVSEQVNPGSTATLDITVEPDATPPVGGVFTTSLAMSLDATVSWAQWNLGGWAGAGTPAAFDITVTVPGGNVAPTADLGNNGPVNEGSAATITFTNQFDPSAEDTAAGFHYAFACDGNAGSLPTTYAAAGTSASTTCTFPDEGSYSVAGRIFDQHDAYNTYTTTVVVNNVAPTATFAVTSPISEGGTSNASLTSPYDPSSADTTAGFHYDFDCLAEANLVTTYAAAGTDSTGSCPFADNGTGTVWGRIFDEDNGYTTYSATVTVSNVAPVVTPPANQTATAGVAKSFTLGSFSDPGVNDNPWALAVDWGDGGGFQSLGTTSTQGAIAAASHTYATANTYTVTVRVTDKDGGAGTATFTVTVSAAVAQSIYYLHNIPTPPTADTASQIDLLLTTTAPTATTLYNYDTNLDASPGRLILRGGDVVGPGQNKGGAEENELPKYQNWHYDVPPGQSLVVSGNVEFRIFTGIRNFTTDPTRRTVRGHLHAYLRDCNPAGTVCPVLGSVSVDRASWHGGLNQWMEEVIVFPGVSETIVSGHYLEVKIIVYADSGDDMWFAYDTTTYMSRLTWPVP